MKLPRWLRRVRWHWALLNSVSTGRYYTAHDPAREDRDDYNAMVLCRRNKDGTITVIDGTLWK